MYKDLELIAQATEEFKNAQKKFENSLNNFKELFNKEIDFIKILEMSTTILREKIVECENDEEIADIQNIIDYINKLKHKNYAYVEITQTLNFRINKNLSIENNAIEFINEISD